MQSQQTRDFSWPLWPVVPLYPYGKRRTIRKEVVADTIWTFDQLQGIFYVVVPIRMTAVRLESGGLLIYAPVAPTPECLRLVRELTAEHGDVKYIILPTISGLEHKAFVGPFARCFCEAQVFVAPNQWSFPLNLPLSWLGFPPQRTQVLPKDSRQTPFAGEFDCAILDAIDLNLGWFSEVAFFHKASRTLLLTDSAISVPADPPAIVQLDPYPLLFHAKDRASDRVEDTQSNRRKGWQRIALFALYFQPSVLNLPKWSWVFRNALKASDRSPRAYFGLFPFQWQEDWKRSFEALRGGGRLLVAPILQKLILNRAPQATLAWRDRIASWDFQRLIACHFEGAIAADPQQFRQAFSFLEQSQAVPSPLPAEDLQLLEEINKTLMQWRVVPPVPEHSHKV